MGGAVQRSDLRLQQEAELREIKARLTAKAEELTELLLGEKPSARSGTDLRFYPHGAFKLTVRGRGRGLWHDHGARVGGSMLDLIAHRLSYRLPQDLPHVVAWARGYLGMPPPREGRGLSPEERAVVAERLDRQAAEAAWRSVFEDAALRVRHEEVARRCEAVWLRSRPAPAEHPYLLARGVQPHGLRLDSKGRLRIPLRDAAGRIWSFQTIEYPAVKWRPPKLFTRRARSGGLFFVLGDVRSERPVAFAEGFATGASVQEATGLPVVVCFSVGNKRRVVAEWVDRHPGQMLIDAADNDHQNSQRNAGAEMAETLRREFGVIPALPPFLPQEAGKDWNDFHRARGAQATLQAIREAVRAARRECAAA